MICYGKNGPHSSNFEGKQIPHVAWLNYFLDDHHLDHITKSFKSVLSENLGDNFGGTQCYMGDCLILIVHSHLMLSQC